MAPKLDVSVEVVGFSVLGIICACFGHINWSVLYVLLAGSGVVHHFLRQRQYYRQRQRAYIQREAHNFRALHSLLETFPSWIHFSEEEQGVWLNDALAKLWPSLKSATEELLRDSLEPVLNQIRPPLLSEILFHTLDLGHVPPAIVGINLSEAAAALVAAANSTHSHDHAHSSTYSTGSAGGGGDFDSAPGTTPPSPSPRPPRPPQSSQVLRSLYLDLRIKLAGETNVVLSASTGPVTVSARLNNLNVNATLRIQLGPLGPEPPFFKAVAVSLLKKPHLSFQLSAVNIPLMSIPGLANVINTLLKDTLASHLLWPKKIIFPLVELDEDEESLLRDISGQGLLTVMVRGIQGYGMTDLVATSKLRVQAVLSGMVQRTAAVPAAEAMTWNEPLRFNVQDTTFSTLHCAVLDTDGRRVEEVDISLSSLAGSQCASLELPLASTANATLMLELSFARFLQRPLEPRELEHLLLASSAAASASSAPAPRPAGPTASLASGWEQGAAHADAAGVLFAWLESVAGLPEGQVTASMDVGDALDGGKGDSNSNSGSKGTTAAAAAAAGERRMASTGQPTHHWRHVTAEGEAQFDETLSLCLVPGDMAANKSVLIRVAHGSSDADFTAAINLPFLVAHFKPGGHKMRLDLQHPKHRGATLTARIQFRALPMQLESQPRHPRDRPLRLPQPLPLSSSPSFEPAAEKSHAAPAAAPAAAKAASAPSSKPSSGAGTPLPSQRPLRRSQISSSSTTSSASSAGSGSASTTSGSSLSSSSSTRSEYAALQLGRMRAAAADFFLPHLDRQMPAGGVYGWAQTNRSAHALPGFQQLLRLGASPDRLTIVESAMLSCAPEAAMEVLSSDVLLGRWCPWLRTSVLATAAEALAAGLSPDVTEQLQLAPSEDPYTAGFNFFGNCGSSSGGLAGSSTGNGTGTGTCTSNGNGDADQRGRMLLLQQSYQGLWSLLCERALVAWQELTLANGQRAVFCTSQLGPLLDESQAPAGSFVTAAAAAAATRPSSPFAAPTSSLSFGFLLSPDAASGTVHVILKLDLELAPPVPAFWRWFSPLSLLRRLPALRIQALPKLQRFLDSTRREDRSGPPPPSSSFFAPTAQQQQMQQQQQQQRMQQEQHQQQQQQEHGSTRSKVTAMVARAADRVSEMLSLAGTGIGTHIHGLPAFWSYVLICGVFPLLAYLVGRAHFVGIVSLPLIVGMAWVCASFARVMKDQHTAALQTLQQRRLVLDRRMLPAAAMEKQIADLPHWIRSPSFEKIEWVNELLGVVWPFFCQSTELQVRAQVARLLQEACPKGIHRIELSRLHLGRDPPVVGGVSHFQLRPSQSDKVVIDVALCLGNDALATVALYFKADSAPLTLTLTNLFVNGVVRLCFEPLLPIFPCFGSVAVQLLDMPELAWTLRAGGFGYESTVSLSSLPGVDALLAYVVRRQLKALMFPRSLSVDVLNMQSPAVRAVLQPVGDGLLRVCVRRASNLMNTSLFSQPVAFCVVALQDGAASLTAQTEPAGQTADPVWEQTFEFVVFVARLATLSFSLQSKSFLSTAPLGEVESIPLRLLPADTACEGSLPVFFQDSEQGRLVVRIEWKPFCSADDLAAASAALANALAAAAAVGAGPDAAAMGDDAGGNFDNGQLATPSASATAVAASGAVASATKTTITSSVMASHLRRETTSDQLEGRRDEEDREEYGGEESKDGSGSRGIRQRFSTDSYLEESSRTTTTTTTAAATFVVSAGPRQRRVSRQEVVEVRYGSPSRSGRGGGDGETVAEEVEEDEDDEDNLEVAEVSPPTLATATASALGVSAATSVSVPGSAARWSWGALLVEVQACAGLTFRTPLWAQSYCEVSLGGHRKSQTRLAEGAHPQFKQHLSLLVSDPELQTMRLRVLSTTLARTRTQEVGSLSLKLSDVLHSNLAMQGQWPLASEGRGRIEMKVSLRPVNPLTHASVDLVRLLACADFSRGGSSSNMRLARGGGGAGGGGGLGGGGSRGRPGPEGSGSSAWEDQMRSPERPATHEDVYVEGLFRGLSVLRETFLRRRNVR